MKVKVDFGGEWRVTGGPEKFGCLIFDFGWGLSWFCSNFLPVNN